MQDDLVKLCPQCGSEYQMWVERCLDCGANLVLGRPGEGGTGGLEEEMDAETSLMPEGCVHLRTAATGWLRRLSEDLDEAGIRHWTTPPVWRRDPSLFVLSEDHEAAAVVDRARYAIEVPDAGGEAAEDRPRRPGRWREAAEYNQDVKVCPSCGEEYQLWAEVCADCGVPLVRPWDLESARKTAPKVAARAAAVHPEQDDPNACPACGERLPEGAVECPGCGLTLAQPDVCPNCGVDLDHHASGCRRCGYEFFSAGEEN